MARYLLACKCGNSVPVEARHAGGQVVCSCGTKLDVPALRRMHELLPAPDSGVGTGRVWRARDGAMALFIILAVFLAAAGAWIIGTEPKPPQFDAAAGQKALTAELDEMTPSDAWNWWINNGSHLDDGFVVYEFRLPPAEQNRLAEKRSVAHVLLVLAGVALVAVLVLAVWPTPKTRRQPRGQN